jgi:hypothetical protein
MVAAAVLAVVCLGAVEAEAGGSAGELPSAPQRPSTQSPAHPAPSFDDEQQTGDDPTGVSLDVIRRGLATPPPKLILTVPKSQVTFRTEVQRTYMPDFQEYLHSLFALTPVQREWAEWATKNPGLNLLELAKDVKKAWRDREIAKARQDVAQELEALKKANAEAEAKKKQDEKKKNQDKNEEEHRHLSNPRAQERSISVWPDVL